MDNEDSMAGHPDGPFAEVRHWANSDIEGVQEALGGVVVDHLETLVGWVVAAPAKVASGPIGYSIGCHALVRESHETPPDQHRGQ